MSKSASKSASVPLPFDGAITRFFAEEAPESVRKAIGAAKKDTILDPAYPYDTRMDKHDYEDQLAALQIELVKLHAWVRDTGQRIAVVFEGRDAAGKGGTIKRLRENLNPRGAGVVALQQTDRARSRAMVFPALRASPARGRRDPCCSTGPGTIAAWSNMSSASAPTEREPSSGNCRISNGCSSMTGSRLFKIWLNVGRAEQLRRFLDRESDPLKQWKLSKIDVEGLAALGRLFRRDRRNALLRTPAAPWTVIRSDDKRRARLAVIRACCSGIDYDAQGRGPWSASRPGDRRRARDVVGPSGPRRLSGMAKRGYHHGNLRQALVDAALEPDREQGTDRLHALGGGQERGRDAGGGLPPFRRARGPDRRMRAAGHEIFADVMDYAFNDGQPSALAAFEATGRAYLAFARKHPGHYMAMFESGTSANATPELAAGRGRDRATCWSGSGERCPSTSRRKSARRRRCSPPISGR
jgi:polyphosphate kinase 2 (PPK2 family)